MMIRWICACGKPLKAPEKLAGQIAPCPACGACVAVPSLTANVAVAEPALTSVANKSAEYVLAPVVPNVWVPASSLEDDPNYIRSAMRRRNAFEKWTKPLERVTFTIHLSALLAVLTAVGVAIYPHVLDAGFAWLGGWLLAGVWSAAMAVVVGYGLHALDLLFEKSLRGEAAVINVPSRNPRPAIASFTRWSLCFAAGPIVPFFLALQYWIHCGQITLIDVLILGELTVPAVCYGMLGLIVLTRDPTVLHPRPRQVLKEMQSLGPRMLPAGLGIAAIAFVHLCVGIWSIMLLHQVWLFGLIALWFWWFSTWRCAAFALGTLGNWHHEHTPAAAQPAS